jgi:hypothetical protein
VNSSQHIESIKAKIAEQGFSKPNQTRIALFLISMKSLNVQTLAPLELAPLEFRAFSAVNSQLFREIASLVPLVKATRWEINPLTYLKGLGQGLGHWRKAGIPGYLWRLRHKQPDDVFGALAFSHALQAQVRFIPLLPPDTDLEQSNFLLHLYAHEVDAGRNIQLQIRFLKAMDTGMSRAEKTRVLQEKHALVAGMFGDFLQTLDFD